MNPALIILGVVIVLIIYLYFFYSTGENLLSDKMDLTTQQPPIEVANIIKPDSSIYSYEFWVNVGKYSGTKQVLFYRPSDKANGPCAPGTAGTAGTAATPATYTTNPVIVNNIGVYIEGSSPTLKIDYVKNNAFVAGSPIDICTGARQANEKGTIVVTDNFPVQTWVHVIVSVSNNYIDTYINGKLTKSIKESDGIYPPSSTAGPITFGTSNGTILAKLTRTTKATDPQTAWTKYSAGNGESQVSKYLGSLGMDVSLKKDNIEYSKFNLF
jgi:hypothetical protein